MDTIKFFHTNLFKSGTITVTSEHVNFPVENLKRRDFNKMWHSNHGAGSGWGNFLIELNVNDDIVFRETAVEAWRTATLAAGEYDADEACAQIKLKMDAAGGGSVYTVTYSDDTNKFTIVSDGGGGGLFQMNNTGDTALPTIGFTQALYNGALTYTADEIRIHSEERVACDFGGIEDIYGVIIRGHNFSPSAIVRVEFSDDDWVGIDETIVFTIQDDILVLEWDAPKTYRDCRIWIRDWTNPVFYVAMGTPYMGGQFQPETNFQGGGSIDRQDPSNVLPSEDGQESSIQLSRFDLWSYAFHVKGLTEKGYFDTLFDAVGKSKAFFYCEDPDLPLSTTKYVALNSFGWSGRRDVGLWNLSMQLREQR